MTRSREKLADRFGLLANGSSRLWDIAVDASLDRENEWSVQLESQHVSLSFQPPKLEVVSEMLSFLRLHLAGETEAHTRKWSKEEDTLRIGKLGTTGVSLVWDNEQSRRCFILIGPKGGSTLRLTLQRDEIEELIEALRQVAEDLGQTSRVQADSA